MAVLMQRSCFGPEALVLASEAFSRSWSFVERDPLFKTYDRERLQAELARGIFEILEKEQCDSLCIANHAIRRLRERMLMPENA